LHGGIVKKNELQHRRAPEKAHANRPRSVKSTVSKYLLIGGTLLAFGCGAAKAPQLASLVNVPMGNAKKNNVTIVQNDKQGPSEKEDKAEKQKKTEISITELNGYQLKFKQKHGGYYEMVSDNEDRFYLEVSFNKPIYLEDGKKALVVMATIYHNKEKAKDKTDDIFIRLVDVKQNKVLQGWAPDFDKLRKEYKEMTGKDLKYVHVVVAQDKDELGEYVNFYVIPAASKKAVEKGIIESGMPIKLVGVYQNLKEQKYTTGSNYEHVTASISNESNSVVAQK
jgi:hypothetical protein